VLVFLLTAWPLGLGEEVRQIGEKHLR